MPARIAWLASYKMVTKNSEMNLPDVLKGKITVSEWDNLRIDRLETKDRMDVIDVLKAIKVSTPKNEKRGILRMTKGLVDDLATIYD
ncbi:MAG: hypothetical protein A3G34_07115 [Candidatus Lindowbacteria bacterium RIFCSPLOWO2_12_FULL_62_27]|nr:MAG: hypothetical protein A3G34_07115 [Candidatus Lindowbacteria bacterium RIFCSPLOWO2_12_FULL_62_27]OGH61804.1 MAG: hypothetical protein A3I06_09300 [Candidatus Lindowbacteria bacterium RIFCSPLOWO2_02_FULL_62_12]